MRDIIEMAREAGFETMLRKGKILGFDRDGDYTEELKAFESLVRADEREACHALRQTLPNPHEHCQVSAHAYDMAIAAYGAAIRAGGNT